MFNAAKLSAPSEIYPGLWLAGSRWPYPDGFRVDVLVTLCEDHERWHNPAAGREVLMSMPDSTTDGVTPEQVGHLVDDIVNAMRRGETVLIRCHWGIERSGMVAALALRRLTGDTFRDVVKGMRQARSSDVLFNPNASAYRIASA